MRTFLLAGVAALAWAGAAHADVITTFAVSGLFENGATLGGLVEIDTTSGKVTSSSLVTGSPIQSTYGTLTSQGYSAQFGGYDFFTHDANAQSVGLLVPLASLVGYTGGNLSSQAEPSTTNYVSGYNGTIRLSSGSLVAVPEPAALALLALPASLAGLVAMRRRGPGAA